MKSTKVKGSIKPDSKRQKRFSKQPLTKDQRKLVKGGDPNGDTIPLFIIEDEGQI